MTTGNSGSRKAQLDKREREQIEDVVTDLRTYIEGEIEYELEQQYDLTRRDGGDDLSGDTQDTRERLVKAVDRENPGGRSWEWCYRQYVKGVGYTFINRMAALRCMEVRGFVDRPVTQMGESGLTPAAETVLAERFDIGRGEALVAAFEQACERYDEEIELLFDTNSPYTILSPDPDTLETTIEHLDRIPADSWRADDVLGWIYEYYNVDQLDDLRRKGDREGFDPEDVPPANQFYTPHWVVRMLTDNSLGKLYLEDTGELSEAVEAQKSLSPDERKNRPLSPDDAPDIADFCTYLVPSEEDGEPPDFDGPRDLRVIDPACGSGHFLLYAFDVLERIYRAETDIDQTEIPREILRNNLYGIDLDMRACQLAVFNLYLKGRTRAEVEGASGFDMPEVGIVCADAKVADIEGVDEVFDEVAGGRSDVEDALQQILGAFEEVYGLGSLLDVRGTLGDLFDDEVDEKTVQVTLDNDPQEEHTLGQILHSLREAVEKQQEGANSFLAQDLRSFVRLLEVLVQNYDVALMNPPYGSRKRMPDNVQKYVENQYEYFPDYYISFVEKCRSFTRDGGRIGVLIPRSFMFKKSFKSFRRDFVEYKGSFDFLAEFGLGILDNATVRTVGTILRSGATAENATGTFFRLHDLGVDSKETVFSSLLSGDSYDDIKRIYRIPMSEFRRVPETPISYYVPREVRRLHDSNIKIDSDVAKIDGKSIATIATGLQTGNNNRFLRQHWEVPDSGSYKPYAKGGSDAWISPAIKKMVAWNNNAREIQRIGSSRFQNSDYYGKDGVTWTYIKDTGRRFGYLPSGNRFDVAGSMVFPTDVPPIELMAILNSELYHMIMLSLTPERQWNQGDVGRLPWLEQIHSERLEQIGESQYKIAVQQQYRDPTSPYYVGPSLLPATSKNRFFYQSHPFTDQESPAMEEDDIFIKGNSFGTLSEAIVEQRKSRTEALEKYAKEIDNHIYQALDLGDSVREPIEQEIVLRGTLAKPGDDTRTKLDLEREIKDLIHHFTMEAIREEYDGIIPLHGTDDQLDMLDHIVERFDDTYGEHAKERLAEVDGILGTASAADEAYPNLQTFIEEDLFAYHVDTMENTPIIWKLSTERLLADTKSVGFGCFVDYHQLDASLFDRLIAQYLEPRKAELRERQSTADRRRNNESLTTSERSDATETYKECTSALQQIAEFENAIKELGGTSKRDFDSDDRTAVRELTPKVTAFQEETAKRIDTLEELRRQNSTDWFQDTFSDKFWDNVDEWRDEWLDALEELKHACEAYAKPSDEPVEAHLADLFEYFTRRLKGSDHYSSSGILFMTYYFEREGANLLNEDDEPFENLSPDEERLASLAMGLDNPSVLEVDYLKEMTDGDRDIADLQPLAEYKALAEEIDDRCQAINGRIPSEWKDRALSEITTAGYQPNHKYGVEINITPLVKYDLVPNIVNDKVI